MKYFTAGDKVTRTHNFIGGLLPNMVYEVERDQLSSNFIKLVGVLGMWASGAFQPYQPISPESVLVLPGEADPNGLAANAPGAKLDAGKLRPTLILRDMARALEAVIKIATDGAVKYSPGGWLEVPNGLERYDDADLRHMLKRFKGQPVDDQSRSLHLAHEAWNALAKLELHLREQERNAE